MIYLLLLCFISLWWDSYAQRLHDVSFTLKAQVLKHSKNDDVFQKKFFTLIST